MKTNYVGHDTEYQRRLKAGSVGWDGSEAEYQQRFEQLAEILAKGFAPQSGSLLELGCGCGNMGLWFAKRGFKVRGIDIAPTAVKFANERAAKLRDQGSFDIEFVIGDVVELKAFEDTQFDFVYDSHLLHCIIGEDRPKLLQKVRQLLKPNGYFLVASMIYSEAVDQIAGFDKNSYCTIATIKGEKTATRYVPRQEVILEEIRSAGFTILDSEIQTGEEGIGQIFIQAQA